MRTVSHLIATLLFLIPTLFTELAAAPSGDERPETPSKAAELVWPLPPDPPRIRYLGALHGSADFTKKPSRWRRLFLGPEAETGLSLTKPYGVTTDSQGRVYVSDSGRGAVLIFDAQNRQVRSLGDSGQVHLVTPIGIGLDEQGRVFVSDADLDQVFCFSPEGEVLLALGRKEGLRNPTGLAIDTQRKRLYVADSHLHKIFLYSTAGESLGSWGERGTGPGQFNFPTNLTLDNQGNLYVVDTGNFRVQAFSAGGNHLFGFGEVGDGFGHFHRPKGIVVDSEGHIYVADAAFNNFQIFNRDGQLLLFVGSLGKRPGCFWLPAGMHIDASDRIYVVDQINRRVQIFQYARETTTPSGGETPAEGARLNRSPQTSLLLAKEVIEAALPVSSNETR